jgi:hypothetical protein
VLACFVLAWWAFSFPLSYCDSPSWAPAYLARLLGTPRIDVMHRGVLVPAWFELWGGLSVASGFASLIGLVQGVLLAAVVLFVLAWLRRGMTRVELLLLPALALSGLRHAIYSQTLLSEALAIPLVLTVALWILRERVPSLRSCFALGAVSGLAVGVRIENLLLLIFVLARIALARLPWRDRVSRAGLALGVAVAVLVGLAQLAPPVRGVSLGRTMIVAEWMRYTEPPRGPLARLLHFDLVDRLIAEKAGRRLAHIYDGLAPTRRIFAVSGAPAWPAVFRLLAYQVANQPLGVAADRLASLADLHASGYAAFWPGYRAFSAYYSPYDQVFARWDVSDFQEVHSSCPGFARAQAFYFQRSPIRSPSAVRALKLLHQSAEGYARWILRPLFWAAVLACLFLLLRRAGGGRYAWLTALLLGSLVLRAMLVCADERYQLPVDLLAVVWLSLTLRHALGRAGPPPVTPGGALP